MRRFPDSWTTTLAKLGFKRRNKKRRSRQYGRQSRIEALEERQMLAADLDITRFYVPSAGSSSLKVDYSVQGDPASLPDAQVKIYRSFNGTTPWGSPLLTSNTFDPAGSGTITITADFTDFQQDYFLIAQIDVPDDNATNNTEVFEGGLFRNVDDWSLHYHAANSAVNDSITVISDEWGYGSFYRNGQLLAYDWIPGVHVRTHGGNDTISIDDGYGSPIELWGFGGAGDDFIYGGAADDVLYGGDGADTIRGFGGNDFIDGGSDGDWLYGDDGNDVIYGGIEDPLGSTDIGAGYGVGDSIYGGAGDDEIHGEEGNEEIYGGAGNDEIYGGDDYDYILGEAGDDFIDGGEYADTIYGGDGNDELYAGGTYGGGTDYLDGGADNDFLSGENSTAQLYGQAGNDSLLAGGTGSLFGGADNDTYIIRDQFGGNISVTDTGGVDTLDFSQWNHSSGVEVVYGFAPSASLSQTVSRPENPAQVRLSQAAGTLIENVIGSGFVDTLIAPGTPLVVTTLADENESLAVPGHGFMDFSLREALALAAIIPGTDTITFDPSLYLYSGGGATVDLSAALGPLVINSSVVIEGPGADLLTIDAQGAANVFNITSGGATSVTVRGLALTGASSAGVRAQAGGGTTTLDGVEVLGNQGGGVSAWGTLYVTNSTIAENAGGTALAFNYGSAFLTNVTVSGNTSTSNAAGISVGSGSATLNHVTVTNNTADVNNLYSGGSGGLYMAGYAGITAHNSIIANNWAIDGGVPVAANAFLFNPYGSIGGTYNLVGANSPGFTTGNNNIIVTDPAAVGLAPLANYGGRTRTHALLDGSPALDAGNPSAVAGSGGVPLNDQRGPGFGRVLDGNSDSTARIDIGAFESSKPVLEVDTLVDENDGDYGPGDLSLREAVELAELTQLADVITFAPSVVAAGELVLNSTVRIGGTGSEVPLTGDLTIQGPGFNQLSINLDGNPGSVFSIEGGSGDVTIAGLTLTGATFGSGATKTTPYSSQILTLEDARATGNATGVQYVYSGFVTIRNSEISNNFGTGVSIVYSNSSQIENSTIAENGGIGMSLGYASANIINSTISSNQSVGSVAGISVAFGSVTLNHSTVADNRADKNNGSGGSTATGGLYASNAGTYYLHNTIVAGNVAGAEGTNEVAADLGRVTAQPYPGSFSSTSSYNVVGYDATGTFPTGNGNQVGTNASSPIDPRLAPLGNYGGRTRTHALLSDSPAIDAGNPSAVAGAGGVPLYDQRGFGRVSDGNDDAEARIDIGATEAAPQLVVDTTVDEIDGDYAPGDLSLREALALAIGVPGPDTIQFDPSVFSQDQTIVLDQELGLLLVDSDVTIDGPGADLLTVDANGIDSVFSVTADESTIFGLTLTGASVAAVEGGGDLSIRHSEITDSATGVKVAGSFGALVISDSTIAENYIGIDIYDAYNTTIANSTISGNQGTGLVSVLSGSTIINSTITDNSNAVYIAEGPATFHNSIISGNGSGIYLNNDGMVGASSSYNLFSNSDPYFQFEITGPGNQLGVTDPGLAPLDFYGGPTRTHAPLVGSPAVDAGNPASLAGVGGVPLFDQRGAGFTRVFDGRIDIGAHEANRNTADIVFIVDESGSMDTEHAWLQSGSVSSSLESALQARGITAVRYGLVGFGQTESNNPGSQEFGHVILVGGAPLGSADQFTTASASLVHSGGTEDGYAAVDFALDTYQFRAKAPVNIILVTDEDRDYSPNRDLTGDTNSSNDYGFLLQKLQTQNAALNVVVNATFLGAPGNPPNVIGVINQDGDYLLPDGNGGFELRTDATNPTNFNPIFGTTFGDYISLAWDLSGAMWDLNVLRANNALLSQSFTAAFAEIKAEEIAGPDLVEADRLVTTDSHPTVNGMETVFTVPTNADAIRVGFTNLQFDDAGNVGNRDINDAFEIAILRTDTGRSALSTIDPDSDAVFNITQGQSPVWAEGVELLDSGGQLVTNPGTDITSGFVQIDVSSLDVGTELRIVARLVNNDSDDTSSVSIDLAPPSQGSYQLLGDGSDRLLTSPVNQTDQILPNVRFGLLHDVSTAFDVSYTHTTFNTQDIPPDAENPTDPDQLEARVIFTKKPSLLQVRGDLLLAVKPPVDQQTGQYVGTQLLNVDGRLPYAIAGLPAGTPFVRLSNLLPSINGFYEAAALEQIELIFQHPNNDRFDFDLVVLGELNEAPSFVSDPYADVRGQAYPIDVFPTAEGAPVQMLEIVAQNGNTFRYTPATQDPNDDRVRIEIIGGPVDMVVDPDDGDFGGSIAWEPSTSDAGVHEFVLRAVDEHGAYDPANDQVFNLRVIANSFNRPPRFTTDPETSATFGELYEYDADAFDPDGHVLEFSGIGANDGLGARPVQYEISIGEYFAAGEMNYLIFVNDDDNAATLGNSRYSNIRLYEADQVGAPQILKFNADRFVPYQTSQGQDGQGGIESTVEVLGDGSVVHVRGNAWKAYQLDTPYQVTPNTVLAFSFASETQGELHGIGLDNQTSALTNGRWFELYGTQAPAPQAVQAFNNLYSPAWPETPDFAVDPNTGLVTWNPPADMIGQWVHVDLQVTETGAHTPKLSDVQSYELFVQAHPENRPPIITSEPVEHHELAAGFSPPDGIVTVDGVPVTGPIDLDLELGESITKRVTVTRDDDFTNTFTGPDFIAGPEVIGTLTFADVGSGDTITRASGSWTSDGFEAGQYVDIVGSANNDGRYLIASLNSTTLTLEADEDLVPEGPTITVTARGRNLVVRTSADQEVQDFITNGSYANYEEAILDILTNGDTTGLSNLSVNLNQLDQGGFTNGGSLDLDLRSFGIFTNPNSDAYPAGTYGLGDFGVVLSTGHAGDYGWRTDDVFENSTFFGDSSDGTRATEDQEFLLDQITDGSRLVTITVDDPVNGISQHTIQWDAVNTDFTTTPVGPAYSGETWSYDPDSSIENGTDSVYELTGAPDGIVFNDVTGAMSWQPAAIDVGNDVYFQLTATNQFNGSKTSQTIKFPVLQGPATSQSISQVTGTQSSRTVMFAESIDVGASVTVDSESDQAGISISPTGTPGQYFLQWSNPPGNGGNLIHRDATQLDFTFDAPDVHALFFNVTFASEEYDRFFNSTFIDAFGIFINGVNVATLDGIAINIDHPNMVFADGSSNPENGNPSGDPLPGRTWLNGVLVEDPAVQSRDAVITFTVPIVKGSTNNKLTFIVADSGDAALDTTVYVSGISTFDPNAVDIRLQSSEPAPITINSLNPGTAGNDVYVDVPQDGTAEFDVTFTGDGSAHGFDLEFVFDTNESIRPGTIPVTINNDYFYLVTAEDPDDDPLTFSLPFAPGGATIDPTDGRITWDPPNTAGANVYDFIVRVEDGRGGFDEQAYQVTVDPGLVNTDPTITDPGDQEARVGRPFSLPIEAQDDDKDPLKYYLTGSTPIGMEIDADGRITWTPQAAANDIPIEVTVYDGRGGTATTTLLIDVIADQIDVNAQPEITSEPPLADVIVGEVFEYDVTARDDDLDPYTFDLPIRPAGMTINSQTGELVWEPTFQQAGTHTVMVRVQDNRGGKGTQVFEITVINPNVPPVIQSIPHGPAKIGQQYVYEVDATDDDGHELFWDVELLSSLMAAEVEPTIDANGVLTWTPLHEREALIRITADDAHGGVATQTFYLPIVIDNAGPKFIFDPADPVVLDEPWTYQVKAEDPEDGLSTTPGSPLRFSIDAAAEAQGFNIIAETGVLTWTPSSDESATVVVTVTDSQGASAQAVFQIPVNVRTVPVGQNEPPKFESEPSGSAIVGRAWTYLVTVSDLDDDSLDLTFTVTDDVGTLVDPSEYTTTTFYDAPGKKIVQFLWAPNADFVGPAHIEIVADDGNLGTATQSIELPVIDNAPPFIIRAVQSAGASVGQEDTYEFEVIDFNGDNLRLELVSPAPGTGRFTSDAAGNVPITAPFAASNDPANPSNFYLHFTPDSSGQRDVTVRVTDSGGKRDEHTIHLDVINPNNNPPDVRLEVPTTVFLGDTLDIRVQGDNPDADGDHLRYYFVDDRGNRVNVLSNRTTGGGLVPNGMTIDELSGRITWTPEPEQLTPPSDVPFTFTVLVTDGRFNVTLGPAELQVIERPEPDPMINTAPFIVRAPAQARIPVGQSITFTFSFIDFDRDNLTLSDNTASGDFVSTSLSNVSDDPAFPTTVDFNYTAPAVPGPSSFTIFVDDDEADPVEYTVQLDVFEATANTLPSGSLRARELAAVDELFEARVEGTDPNGQTLEFKLVAGSDASPQYVDAYSTGQTFNGQPTPTGMQIDPVTGRITWTPSTAQLSDDPYTYAVAIGDGIGFTRIGPVEVTVIQVFSNTPPRITSSPEGISAAGGQPLVYQATAEDDDDDPVTWTLISGPSTASIDQDGRFTWNPGPDEFGTTQTAIIQVSDPYGPGQQQGITLHAEETYIPGNTAPQITSTPTQPGFGGETYRYLVRARDDEGHKITLTIDPDESSSLSGTSFTDHGDGTASFVWTSPPAGETRTFKFVATDELGLSGGQTIVLTIGSQGTQSRVDTPPTIHNRPPQSVAVGNVYFHQIQATDPDVGQSGPIVYSISTERLDGPNAGSPVEELEDEGFDEATGLINWTPSAADEGVIRVTIRATQPAGGAWAGQTYSLQVIQPGANPKPQLGNPVALQATPGQSFSFNVPGSNEPAGEPFEFFLVDADGSLTQQIDGLEITADGLVTWEVPEGIAIGQERTFTVDLQDQAGQRSTGAINYTITIVGDQPPSVGLNVSTLRPEPDTTVGFSVIASDDIGIIDRRLTISHNGGAAVDVPVATDGTAQFQITGFPGDTYDVIATAIDTNGQETMTEPIRLIVRAVNVSAPIVTISSPFSGILLEEGTDLEGRIYDPDPNGGNLTFFSVTATPSGGGAPITLVRKDIADPESYDPMTDLTANGLYLKGIGLSGAEFIAALSPFALATGTYQIDIVARDAAGAQDSDSIVIGIESNAKLGNFSLSFVDMSVNVGGQTVTVARKYDTLEAEKRGDFGYGWSLDVITGQVEYLRAGDSYSDFKNFLGYDQAITGGSRLTVTLPNGEVHGFTAVPVPILTGDRFNAGAFLTLANIWALAFEPDPGQNSRLDFVGGIDAQGRVNNSNTDSYFYPDWYLDLMPILLFERPYNSLPVIYNESTGEFNLASTGGATAGLPANFDTIGGNLRLITRDMSEYEFDSATGELLRSSDFYGNTIDFTGNDIVAKDGSNQEIGRLTILRDDPAHSGLITRVENGLGFGVNYVYDGSDDLIAVVEEIDLPQTPDPRTRETTFVYDTDPTLNGANGQPHYLRHIIDPQGREVAAVTFDDEGRIETTATGDPNDPYTQQVVYNPGQSMQTVTDAFGIETEYEFDARGNINKITQQTELPGPYNGADVIWQFTHDDENRITSQTDPMGRVTTWTYENDGQRIIIVEPHDEDDVVADFTTVINRNDLGFIESIAGPHGRTEYRSYNEFGDLTQITDETGHIFAQWGIGEDGRLFSETSGGSTTTYDYFGNDHIRITSETEAVDAFFDKIGQLTSFEDDGGVSTLAYDGLGRVAQAMYDDGELTVDYEYGINGVEGDWTQVSSESTGTIGRQFTPGGQLAGWTLANGGQVQYIYDKGRLDKEIDPLGRETQYVYDELGRVREIQDLASGNFIRYTYDLAGRVLQTENALGEIIEYAYPDDAPDTVTNARGYTTRVDVNGLTTITTEAVGTGVQRETQVVRNAAGLPVKFVNADDTYTTIGYLNSDVLGDAAQLPTFIRDESGRERLFTYFEDGRLKTATSLAGGDETTSYTYNPSTLRLETVTLPNGKTVTYNYDDDGRIVSIERDGLGTYMVSEFNDDSQPKVVTLPSGETVTIEYDDAGRVETRNVDNGESATFTYVAGGDAVETIDDNTGVTTYTYYNNTDNRQEAAPGPSHAGKLEKIEYPNGTSIEYTYDALGRVATLTTRASSGGTAYTTTYTYDENGNVETVLDPFGGLTTYTYDELDRLATRTLPNGVQTTWTFDNRDRLESIVHRNSGGAVISSFTYEHPANAVGEPHKIIREDNSYVLLTYDPALRVQKEEYFNSSNQLQRRIEYSYDAQGNRTSRTTFTGTTAVENYTIDPVSGYKLTSIDGPGSDDSAFGYDSGGRMISLSRDNDPRTLAYNAAGQLTAVNDVGGSNIDYTYQYDALGNRTSAAANGGSVRNFLVAPAAQRLGPGALDVTVQHLAANSSGQLLNGWVYAGENPILRFDAGGNAVYYLEDASDSIAALVNSSQVKTADYRFDAFGNLLAGSVGSPTSNAGGDFGFHAAWRESATGLYHMRARTYDPETGRFTTPDPATPNPQLPETYEPYSFANNNPHLYSDPTGLFSLIEINVTINVQSMVQNLKSIAVNQAKDFATDKIYEAAANTLGQILQKFIPGASYVLELAERFDNGDPWSDLGNAFEGQFLGEIREFFEDVPFGEKIWLGPRVNTSGFATKNGINLALGGKLEWTRDPQPDFLIREGEPTNHDLRSWLIGDVKLSVTSVYYSVAVENSTQWQAIRGHAKEQSLVPVSLYITLLGAKTDQIERAQIAEIQKKTLGDGVPILILKLLG